MKGDRDCLQEICGATNDEEQQQREGGEGDSFQEAAEQNARCLRHPYQQRVLRKHKKRIFYGMSMHAAGGQYTLPNALPLVESLGKRLRDNQPGVPLIRSFRMSGRTNHSING